MVYQDTQKSGPSDGILEPVSQRQDIFEPMCRMRLEDLATVEGIGHWLLPRIIKTNIYSITIPHKNLKCYYSIT